MADEKGNRGTPSAFKGKAIQDWRLRYWAKKFDVPRDELRAAVETVGSSTARIAEYLSKRPAATGTQRP